MCSQLPLFGLTLAIITVRACLPVQQGNTTVSLKAVATSVLHLDSPTKLSRKTSVNLLPRNGICLHSMRQLWMILSPRPNRLHHAHVNRAYRASASSARMHSLSASKLLLISAPSSRVCLSLSYVSAEGGRAFYAHYYDAMDHNRVTLRPPTTVHMRSQGCASNAPAPRSLPAKSMNDSLPTSFWASSFVRSAKHSME